MSPQNRLMKEIIESTSAVQERVVAKAEKLKNDTQHLWQKTLDIIHPDDDCADEIKKDRETRDGRGN